MSLTARQILIVLAAVALSLTVLVSAAEAPASGGISPTDPVGPGNKAKLVGNRAVAPASAPERVKRVIAAANEIRTKPYKWGGGHGSWKDNGYDCSGAVSYALHGGGLLDTPLDSNGLARYGRGGDGAWITVYGNPSHAYMIVAGLRFDTANTTGNGPSWSTNLKSTSGRFTARHPNGL